VSVRLKETADLVTSCVASGERPFVALEHLESGTGRLTADIELPECTAPETGAASVEPGDVLFGKLRPYLAKTWLADRPAFASTELLCLRPRAGVDSRWLAYLVASNPVVKWAVATSDGTKMPRTSWERLAEYRIGIPPIAEQRAIADYLDRETARIDALIEAEQRRVALSEARLVAETQGEVVGRIDTEPRQNDPTGPLLPIPEGWSLRRNKTFLREVVDLSEDGSEDLLTVSHLTGVTPRAEKEVTMFLAESNVGYKRVRPNDVVVNTMWAWMGALGVSNHYGIVSPAYGVYRFSDSDADPLYFDALVRSPAYVEEMTRYSKGVWTSRLRLYPESFLSLRSPFPPADAQRKIAQRVRVMQRDTGRVSWLLGRSVELLQERRRALITAAVTGGLEIPGVAA
jgi:type I restriction enzyme S subunit